MFRQVLAFLETNNHQYHTFIPKHDMPLSFLIRGLEVDFPLEDIPDDLRDLSYLVRSIYQVYARSGPRRPLPLVRFLVKKAEADESLLSLTRLLGFRVTVERNVALPQFHRC